MVDFKITVVTDTAGDRFVPAIHSENFGKGFAGRLFAWKDSGSLFSEEEGGVLLFLSENAAHVREILSHNAAHCHVVYIGDVSEVSDCTDALYDIWAKSDEGAVLKRRYLSLLGALRDRFLVASYEKAHAEGGAEAELTADDGNLGFAALGNLFGTLGAERDAVTLQSLHRELSLLIENMPFPMAVLSVDKKLILFNSYFRRIVVGSGLAYQKKDKEGEFADWFDFSSWKQAVATPQGKEQASESGQSVSGEYRIRVNGKIKRFTIMELQIRNISDSLSGYFCVMQDITFQRTYERSILKAANTDMLTGLYNRRYFYDYLAKNLEKEFHLLYIDLDRFKVLNDTYGHNIGDRVLEIISSQLRRYFPNDITARLGGDEFAVIDEMRSEAELEERISAFEKASMKSFSIYECGTGVSVGLVFNDGTHTDIDELIRMGDVKMYEVKKKHHKEEE